MHSCRQRNGLSLPVDPCLAGRCPATRLSEVRTHSLFSLMYVCYVAVTSFYFNFNMLLQGRGAQTHLSRTACKCDSRGPGIALHTLDCVTARCLSLSLLSLSASRGCLGLLLQVALQIRRNKYQRLRAVGRDLAMLLQLSPDHAPEAFPEAVDRSSDFQLDILLEGRRLLLLCEINGHSSLTMCPFVRRVAAV